MARAELAAMERNHREVIRRKLDEILLRLDAIEERPPTSIKARTTADDAP
jgi:hypothetical protein